MSGFLVDKSGTRVDHIDAQIWQRLLWYSEQGLSSNHSAATLKWLEILRSKGLWISCDCTSPQPTLSIVRLENGLHFLRNNPTSPDHSYTCPLHKKALAQSRAKLVLHDRNATRPIRVPLFSTLMPNSSVLPEHSDESKSNTHQNNYTLKEILFTLIENAGLNSFSQGIDQADRWRALMALKVSSEFFFLDNEIPLSRFFRSWLDDSTIAKLAVELKGIAPNWPKSSRPTGIIVDVVDRIDGNRLIIDRKNRKRSEVIVRGKLEVVGKVSSACRHLVCVSISGTSERPSYLDVTNAVALPVVSRMLLPCFSELEKSFLEAVSQELDASPKGYESVRIFKPLFPFDGDLGATPPSYVLLTPQRLVAIVSEGQERSGIEARFGGGSIDLSSLVPHLQGSAQPLAHILQS